MRKLINIPSYSLQRHIHKYNSYNLFFTQQYFIRSRKNKQNFIQHSQNVQGKQSKPNKPNTDNKETNPQNNKPKINITGPKRIIQLIKAGHTKITPFYVNNFLNKLSNPTIDKLNEENNNNNKSIFNSQINPKQNVLQQLRKKIVINSGYPFQSSHLFKQRLMKKYKIIQSLKATKKKQDQPIQKFDSATGFRFFINLFAKNEVIPKLALLCISLAILTVYAVNLQQNKLPSSGWQSISNDQPSDNQLLAKLNQIQQIQVSPGIANSYKIKLIFKQKRRLNAFQQIFSLLDMDVEKQKYRVYETQNPNLILDGLQKVQEQKSTNDWVKVKPYYKNYTLSNAFFDTLFLSTPFIGIGITYWIFRKVNPQSMMKNFTSQKKSMKIQSLKDIKVRFKDVAGMQGAKKEITQFVDFLKKSDKYVQMGAKIPKGALLTGPPGTGKTMLAKACAGQAGTSFFYVSGSQFVQMFVGLGASRVRQLFARARQQAPSIIFIDEIDAIGKKRQTSRNEQKDSTLNQMLVEMDGFSSSQTVIVLAATNRKDILDSALTRPGRFDRLVQITLPQIKARQEIFMVHLTPLKINPQKPLSQLAKRLSQLTPGFSGADIANLCNEAAIIATRKNRTYIEDVDFEQASQRIMAGYVKKGLANTKTRKRVAYHQAGHAVCGWYLRGGDPLVKLTIIPRSKGALGYAQYLPKTAYIRTKTQLIDQVSIMLGGTTSQQIFLGNVSSGNSDDLQKVYSLTRRMVTQFGMGSKTYNVTLDEQTYVKKQSQKLCNIMEEQIIQIVNQATKRANQIIQLKRDIVQKLAEQLLAKQTINNQDILRIMGQRPAFA